MAQKTLEWIPLEKLGPFELGSPINNYDTVEYGLQIIPDEYNKNVDWVVYGFNNEDRVYVENGQIVSVLSTSTCVYKGENLIGLPADQITGILNCEPDSVETEDLFEDPQVVYEFDDLGLQLWAIKGIVESVIVSDSEEE